MLALGSDVRGTCRECRHSNHGTDDADEGFWACPWLGATSPQGPCRIVSRAEGRFVFELFDGTNGTWGTGDPVYRSVPEGFGKFPIRAAPDCPRDQALLPKRAGRLQQFIEVVRNFLGDFWRR